MAQRLNRSLIISGLTLYSLISVSFAAEGSDSLGESGSRHLQDNQNLSHLPQGAFKKEDTRDPNIESNLTAIPSTCLVEKVKAISSYHPLGMLVA